MRGARLGLLATLLVVGCGIGGIEIVDGFGESGGQESGPAPSDDMPEPSLPGVPGASGGPTTGTEVGNPVAGVESAGFSLTLEGALADAESPTDDVPPAGPTAGSTAGDQREAEATVRDDRGTQYRLVAAFAQVKEAKLTLTVDRHCYEIREQLAGQARCEHDSGDRPGSDEDDDDGDEGGRHHGKDDGKMAHKIIVGGPVIADLLNGTTSPSWEGVRVPATEYDQVEVKLTKKAGLLLGASFVAEALFDRPDGQGEALLRIRLQFDEKLKYDDPSRAVKVMPDGSLIAALDASIWLEDTPLDECIADGRLPIIDGVVSVNYESDNLEDCADLERAIRDNIKRSAKLAGD